MVEDNNRSSQPKRIENRGLLMSSLDDCRRALDGKVMGVTPQSVAETLDSLSEALTHSELKAMRAERRSSS